jgi:ATP-dependent DNA helicase RecQ
MLNILKKHFGYSDFRPLQEDVIKNVLDKKDTFVLMPTGGGKSLCYQLPALKMSGVTLVISPLIALMKDQVDALQANGVQAEFINSSLSYTEIQRVTADVVSGKVKILYIAPERLAMQSFQSFLKSLEISLIAIDEAHCISEWGHDFRPDYRNLKFLRKDFPSVPVIALTATATKKVQKDIVSQLNLENAETFISSFNRDNLTYHVEPKKKSFNKLLYLLDKHKNKPVIIYCFSRKNTENLAEDLRNENFNALAYHAGLDVDTRKKVQEKFIRDEVPIITATIAFGMGIDKPDIRLIVHYNLPKTIEGYYQETGRAGRDGLPSECMLFYSYGDTHKHQYFIEQIEDDRERKNVEEKLFQVVNFCELSDCRRKYLLNYFGEDWHEEDCKGCDTCLQPKEKFDATLIAQKVLSAVLKTGESFGSSHINAVLRGSRSKKILERGHDKLSVYDIVQDYSEPDLRRVIEMLIGKNFISRVGETYKVLKTTDKGRIFLKERQTLELPKIVVGMATSDKEKKLDYDKNLFEILRRLRKKIADEKNVPPFVIFGDQSLIEMASYFPQSKENFSRIFGVGQEKLNKFGDMFLNVISEYAKEKNISEKEILKFKKSKKIKVRGERNKNRRVRRSSSTYAETKKMIEQKMSIKEIAKARNIALKTIFSHLEELVDAGEKLDLEYLKASLEDRFENIKKAFEISGLERLKPVFEHLDGEVEYDDIRLVRVFLKNK